jgi:hypothetical protein
VLLLLLLLLPLKHKLLAQVWWCEPWDGRSASVSSNVNGKWKLMCSQPQHKPTKFTQAGAMKAACKQQCTQYTSDDLQVGSTIMLAKLGRDGKLSKNTRLELSKLGYATVSTD